MNSEINGRRYQPICRTVVPSFRSSDALSPGREKKGAGMISSNYPSPRNVSFYEIVSLTYENTLSDSSRRGIYQFRWHTDLLRWRKFIRPEYDLELTPRTPCVLFKRNWFCNQYALLIYTALFALRSRTGRIS